MNFKGAWNNLRSNFALIPLGWGLIFKKIRVVGLGYYLKHGGVGFGFAVVATTLPF